jgi:hypothetical protein
MAGTDTGEVTIPEKLTFVEKIIDFHFLQDQSSNSHFPNN